MSLRSLIPKRQKNQEKLKVFIFLNFSHLNNQLNDQKLGIMVASHNEDTVRFAIEKMKDLDIRAEDKVICFG